MRDIKVLPVHLRLGQFDILVDPVYDWVARSDGPEPLASSAWRHFNAPVVPTRRMNGFETYPE